MRPESEAWAELLVDEDDATLQAALAFVDDIQLVDEQVSASMALYATSLRPDDTLTSENHSTRKRPPSHCVREELIYLRGTVKDLENQLEKLLHGDPELEATDEMWKRVAARQNKERRRAEQENNRLRTLLEEQIKAGKRLERLLLGHKDNVSPVLSGKRLRTSRFTSPLDNPALERQMMDRLFGMYHETDQILAHPSFQSLSVDRVCSVEVQSGLLWPQFVATETRLIPFDFEATGEAMWEISMKCATPARVILQQDVNAEEGTIARLLERSIDLPSGTGQYRVKSVRRRFVETNRIVTASTMAMDALQIGDQLLQGVCVRTQVWFVLEPAHRAGVQRPASILRMYYLAEPEVYDAEMSADAGRTSVGVLSNVVLNSIQFRTDQNYQMLENRLMDRFLGLTLTESTRC
ncbi:hypothetical protein Poli38472_011854 [Pythium oligandrum]|uniref:Uncharacterized protein n=1 Tax=Pythium oligandrum TaxID=41045 RepID=A0A8K1C7U4_PYTOL|nr:hypothetical protein Poli38472_011854 [Pythium oligandrum]|eukprot:TMW58266.1 hypothetical protein Poli38472_011854 [Pythium oligandrum]